MSTIEKFITDLEDEHKVDKERKKIGRKAYYTGWNLLKKLDDFGVTKSKTIHDGTEWDLIRTPFIKVEVGSGRQKIALRGQKTDTVQNGLELIVKAGGEKHTYATVHDARIDYSDESFPDFDQFKLAPSHILGMDKEVVNIIDAVAVAAQKEYGIEV